VTHFVGSREPHHLLHPHLHAATWKVAFSASDHPMAPVCAARHSRSKVNPLGEFVDRIAWFVLHSRASRNDILHPGDRMGWASLLASTPSKRRSWVPGLLAITGALAIGLLIWSVHAAHQENDALERYTEVNAAALGDELVRSIEMRLTEGGVPGSIQEVTLPPGVVFATLLDSEGRVLAALRAGVTSEQKSITLTRPVHLAPDWNGILRLGVVADPLLNSHRDDLQRTLIVNFLTVALTILMAGVVFVAQRSLMLEAIRERSMTKAVLVAMEDAIVVVDRDGRVGMANPAACEMFGTTPQELVGKPCCETPCGAIARGLVEDGAGRTSELVAPGKGPRPVHASLVPIVNEPDGTIGQALIVHDLTDAKRLESERQASRSLVAFGRFAETMAHEVRNPLNAIAVGVQRLSLENWHPDNGSQPQRMLELIQSEVKRLDEIVKGFLELARPSRLDPRPGNLETALEAMMPLLREGIPTGVTITLAKSEIPLADFDPRAIHQVVLNLVRNAVEAVGGQGHIEIVTHEDDNGVAVEIHDDGPGIPAEIRARIFEFGFTTKPSGNGVGLPLVHRLVQEMSGRVEIGSSRLGGARVGVVLPCAVGIECKQG
jgi:signal transduction histidine kinase